MQTPIPSMILRDTSIREQSSSSSNQDSQASLYFRGSSFNNNSGYNSSTFSSRERDCSSPFLSNSGPNNLPAFNNQLLSLGSRENNAIIMRESAPIYSVSRVASNRFLSGGLDQRIIKQSTEDCRRLLQQVSCVHRIIVHLMNVTTHPLGYCCCRYNSCSAKCFDDSRSRTSD